ncbi:hypothetical protein Psuf_077870 [Phytohabitans suffuscus]|uniref:DUF3090 domain-containing protein n=1 Tax=Phytohabitans suffuscus TaxID=624315 RepID=A0A6F8YWN7_9ACTN|nr:hypothetical protein Psuf_077870 [Phytohabitans suffuscus]
MQMSLLAEKLEELLAEAHRRFGAELPEAPAALSDNEPLDTPVDEEFRVGTLGLAYDVDTATVVIEAIAAGESEVEVELGGDAELTDDEDDEDDEPDDDLDRLRVRLTPAAARAFIDRARRVLAAGRPPCPLCGQPLDPRGHLCPATTATTGNLPAMTRLDVQPVLDEGDALRLLRHGEFELEGRLVDASNTTLRGFLTLDGVTARCVYKPVRASARCGTSRTAPWPGGRSRRTWCPARPAGASSRRPCCATGRSGRAPASCGSTSRTTAGRWSASCPCSSCRSGGSGSRRRATRRATRTRSPTPTTRGWPAWPSSTR